MDSRKLDKNECSNKNDIFSDILKEGFLTKQAENWRTWRTRYFILFKDGKLLGYDSGKPTNLGKCNNRFRKGFKISIDQDKFYFRWLKTALSRQEKRYLFL